MYSIAPVVIGTAAVITARIHQREFAVGVGAFGFKSSRVILIIPMSVFIVAMSPWIDVITPFRSPSEVVIVTTFPSI